MQFRNILGPLLAVASLCAAPMPRLAKEGGVFQFMVDDRPFIVLGIQTNNSSGYPGELERTWPLAKRLHVNTIEIPIQWQTVEPVQGKFDFSVGSGGLRMRRCTSRRLG